MEEIKNLYCHVSEGNNPMKVCKHHVSLYFLSVWKFWILHVYQSLSTASIWHWWPLWCLSMFDASSVEIGNFPVSRDSFPGFSSITSLQSSQINCWNIISNIYKRTQYKISFLRKQIKKFIWTSQFLWRLSMDNVCAYCGKSFEGEGWPHVEGDSNRGVSRIEQFCSEEHRSAFLKSNLWFQFTKKAVKEAFLILLFFNFLETLGAQST